MGSVLSWRPWPVAAVIVPDDATAQDHIEDTCNRYHASREIERLVELYHKPKPSKPVGAEPAG